MKGKRFYVGMTGNLKQRLKQHEDGTCHTTKRIDSFSLARVIKCDSKEEAKKIEKKIKKSGHPERWIKNQTYIEFPQFIDTITPT